MAKKKSMPARRSRGGPVRPGPGVVPRLPEGYRDGALPALPLRDTVIHIQGDDAAPPGVQPKAIDLVHDAGGEHHIETTDPRVLQLMLEEGRMRDQYADAAFVELFAAMQGRELTAALMHTMRLRLRKLADDCHTLARVAAATIARRERVKKHAAIDPLAICKAVDDAVAGGMTAEQARLHVADQTGLAPDTIRNTYYKHRTAGK